MNLFVDHADLLVGGATGWLHGDNLVASNKTLLFPAGLDRREAHGQERRKLNGTDQCCLS